MSLCFAPENAPSIPLHVISVDELPTWLDGRSASVSGWTTRVGFTAGLGQAALIPDAREAGGALAVVGYGTPAGRLRGRFHLAGAARQLPEGTYHLVTTLPQAEAEHMALGWLLAQYSFDRYRVQPGKAAQLKCPEGVDHARFEAIANGEALTRDLINTPTSDMGPDALEQAARGVAARFDATLQVTHGDDLLSANFPMIHAVGRASAQAPRLLDMRWGAAGPTLTLVGKGVCFDTGGLNLKPGASMGLMKKDMGGAAAVLGLAHMIMALGLAVRLRVLIPAVENSVSSNSFRPQDILVSRKGLTVEINNTDAEGRLVLADALAFADEESPECLISMATLTGAARVAVGPDIAPYFTDDEAMSGALVDASKAVMDPVWRLPFWEPYEPMIEPGIADLDNAPKGGFAGAITAALFLRRFVGQSGSYTHFDIYGWQPAAAPARPKGGVGQGTRAILEALPARLGL